MGQVVDSLHSGIACISELMCFNSALAFPAMKLIMSVYASVVNAWNPLKEGA